MVVLLAHKGLCPLKSTMKMNGVGNWSAICLVELEWYDVLGGLYTEHKVIALSEETCTAAAYRSVSRLT
jgi:hypothetical protein